MTTTAESTKQKPADEKQVETVAAEHTESTPVFTPPFDIWETEDELTLVGDMPGVSPDDLDIQFENRILTIRGKVPPRHNDLKFLYGEYGIGDFYRTFTVGEAIDASKISAEMKDGVVTLHLPKSESVKPRRIPVNSQ